MADPSSTSSVEDQLFAAMDRQALRLIEMLDDESVDEGGFPTVSIETKLKLFDKGQEWLKRRKVLRPQVEETEGAGIRNMREWINDPANMSQFRDMMFAAGVVLEPEKKNGRPTKAQAEVRKRFNDHKEAAKRGGEPPPDEGWQSMLSAGEGDADG